MHGGLLCPKWHFVAEGFDLLVICRIHVLQCFYSTSPTWGVLDGTLARNRSLVLGGEACIWCVHRP